MTDLTDYARLVAADHGLSVVSTQRADHTIQASVVNTGVLDHRGHQVVGFTTRGDSRKLVNLRAPAGGDHPGGLGMDDRRG
jgi:hypothetical protein